MNMAGAGSLAAGQIGAANAYGGMATGIGNAVMSNQLLNMYGKR
jgi:hypothetical protein